MFGSQPFTTMLIVSNLKEFREELIWLKNKSSNGMNLDKRHNKVHENIIVFSEKGSYTFNAEKWVVKDKQFLTQRKTMSFYGENNNIYGGFKRQRKEDNGTRNPINILPFAIPITPAKTKTYSRDIDLRVHPTQKPVALIEYLIKTYSNENDLILDNCSGSGSLAIAAYNTKRNFICIEKDKDYYEKSVERLEIAQAQLRLF